MNRIELRHVMDEGCYSGRGADHGSAMTCRYTFFWLCKGLHSHRGQTHLLGVCREQASEVMACCVSERQLEPSLRCPEGRCCRAPCTRRGCGSPPCPGQRGAGWCGEGAAAPHKSLGCWRGCWGLEDVPGEPLPHCPCKCSERT